MTLSRLRAQPGKPTGTIGRIVGFLMDIYNREDNHWTVSLLEIGETSKILEIVFGTGLAIADAAKITTLQSSGFVNVKTLDGLNPKQPIYCAIGNKPMN